MQDTLRTAKGDDDYAKVTAMIIEMQTIIENSGLHPDDEDTLRQSIVSGVDDPSLSDAYLRLFNAGSTYGMKSLANVMEGDK